MIRCPRCDGELDERDFVCSGCGLRAARGDLLDLEPDDTVDRYFDPLEFRYRFGAEQRHYWHRARRELLLEVFRHRVSSGSKVLEVGCGCGHVAGSLARAGYRVWGLDLSTRALECAASQGLEQLVRASILELPFEDAFDAVCAFDVIEHIPDHERALAGLVRAARPGGLVLVTVPAHPRLWGSWDRMQRHQRRYRSDELEAMMRAAGLEVVALRQFFRALYLPSLASAAFDRLLGGSRRSEPPLELHHAMLHPPLLGRVAHAMLARERRGINQPSQLRGTSLLAVGRRSAGTGK